MSVQATSWVIQHPEIVDRTEFCVMFALANRADPEGWCWPSEERIARESRCSRRTVQRVMVELIRKGWVIRDARPGTSSRYRLTMPAPTSPAELLDDDEVRHHDAPSRRRRPVDNSPEVRHHDAPSPPEVRHRDAPGASPDGAPGASPDDARIIRNHQETSAIPLGYELVDGHYMPPEMQEAGRRRCEELKHQLHRRAAGLPFEVPLP